MEAHEIERLLITKFRKSIYSPFCKALKQYGLVEYGDRIAICVSGGKDSFLLAKCMQEVARHGKVPFTPVFIAMDPGFDQAIRAQLLANSQTLGLDVHLFESDIFDAIEKEDCNPCFLCARMRRGCLYKYAASMDCNKIALGHHFDDVTETTLMNLFYGSAMKTMRPMLVSDNHPGMGLIRPLYKVREADIEQFWAQTGMAFSRCGCKAAKLEQSGEQRTRAQMKRLLATLRADNPYVDRSVFASAHNVRVSDVVGYTDEDGNYHLNRG